MYGWAMTSEGFFLNSSSYLTNILDNLIATQKIKPLTVVTPTFDSDDCSQEFGRSAEELKVFHQDFREN